ncbi:hypothetical protein [Bacillus altitudinis]|nr:hypothetical protein [Bacillus altitudinis]
MNWDVLCMKGMIGAQKKLGGVAPSFLDLDLIEGLGNRE